MPKSKLRIVKRLSRQYFVVQVPSAHRSVKALLLASSAAHLLLPFYNLVGRSVSSFRATPA
jgi:hypothetical protein